MKRVYIQHIYIHIYMTQIFLLMNNVINAKDSKKGNCQENAPSLVPLRSISGPVLAERLGFWDKWFCRVQSKSSPLSWVKPQSCLSSNPHTKSVSGRNIVLICARFSECTQKGWIWTNRYEVIMLKSYCYTLEEYLAGRSCVSEATNRLLTPSQPHNNYFTPHQHLQITES